VQREVWKSFGGGWCERGPCKRGDEEGVREKKGNGEKANAGGSIVGDKKKPKNKKLSTKGKEKNNRRGAGSSRGSKNKRMSHISNIIIGGGNKHKGDTLENSSRGGGVIQTVC